MVTVNDRIYEKIEFALKHVPESVSLFTMIIILVAYLYCVFDQGPKFMKNRQAYDLRWFISVYNLVQIVANLIFFITAIYLMIYLQLSYTCLIRHPLYLKMTVLYYVLKYCDLVETIVFVLRKKSNQISVLHVYHHVMIISGTYIELAFSTSGHNMIPGIINGFVHAVMYSYYFMSTNYPHLVNSEWFKRWKRTVTQIQLLQFCIVLVHYTWSLIFGHCNMPPVLSLILISQDIIMLYLFGRFYLKTYVKNDKLK